MSLYEQLKTLSNRVVEIEAAVTNPDYNQFTASYLQVKQQLTASALSASNIAQAYSLTSSLGKFVQLTASSFYTPNAVQLTASYLNAAQLTASFVRTTQLTASQGIYSNDNIILAADKGISFSDDLNNIGMTSELFDDYEIGTWTPTPVGFTTTGTVTTSGNYRKIGNAVFITGRIRATTITATAGTSYVSGIPFAAGGGFGVPFSIVKNHKNTVVSYGTGLLDYDEDFFYFPNISPAVADIVFTCFYITSS